jgi:hypothetical protein
MIALTPLGIKALAGTVGVIGIVAIAWGAISSFSHWRKAEFTRAYQAGYDANEARWQTAQVQVERAASARLESNILRSNEAALSYVAEIAAREPKIIKVKERQVIYEKSVDGGARCHGVDGVRILAENRAALDFPALAVDPSNSE